MKDIGLDIPDCQISLYTKQKFKALVKNKIREAAFKYLKDLQTNHSKMQAINYIKFKLQDYLSSPLFNSENASEGDPAVTARSWIFMILNYFAQYGIWNTKNILIFLMDQSL